MSMLFENIHMLQTIVDKSLKSSVREELAKNLPDSACVELREILFNVAVGNVDGFSAEIVQILSSNRLLVFKVVDANEKLWPEERQELISSPPVLKLLEEVLPAILSAIQKRAKNAE